MDIYSASLWTAMSSLRGEVKIAQGWHNQASENGMAHATNVRMAEGIGQVAANHLLQGPPRSDWFHQIRPLSLVASLVAR
jgi:hypothetical protein